MRLRALLRLTTLTLGRERTNAFLSTFGVTVGISAFVFFVALGLGVSRVVRRQIFPVDARMVDVVAPPVSLGLLGGSRLDDVTAGRLKALPGVRAVYRKMAVRVPAMSRFDGDFFGTHLHLGVEVAAVGAEPGLFQSDVRLGKLEEPAEGAPIPALASRRLLEIYNKSFAPTRHLPHLGPDMLVGFTFPVAFNRSYVSPTGGTPLDTQVQIIGLSDHAPLAALTIPLETARRINRAAGVDAQTYSAFTVALDRQDALPALTDEVKRMGLQVDDQERKLAEDAGFAVALTTASLALLSILVCVIAAINIAQTLLGSVRARTREIGILRAVGASRRDVQGLVWAEAGFAGLVGGAAGTLLAWLGAGLVDFCAWHYLPAFPFKPASFFAFPPALLMGGVALGLAAALVGAYFPSRSAAAVEPARVLAG